MEIKTTRRKNISQIIIFVKLIHFQTIRGDWQRKKESILAKSKKILSLLSRYSTGGKKSTVTSYTETASASGHSRQYVLFYIIAAHLLAQGHPSRISKYTRQPMVTCKGAHILAVLLFIMDDGWTEWQKVKMRKKEMETMYRQQTRASICFLR